MAHLPPRAAALGDQDDEPAAGAAHLRFVTDDLQGIRQFVASGVAVAILPRLAMGRLPDGVTVHPLPGIDRRVIAFTRGASALQPTFAVVVDELRRAGAALSAAHHGTGPAASED